MADDEEDIRDIVRFHLEREGFQVVTSENGEEAINALNEFDISLAITDLKMPKMDGFEVLEYMKSHQSRVPVIVLTGYADTDMVVSSMKKGAVDYILKPVKRDEFIDVVRNVMRKKGIPEMPNPFELVGVYLLDKAGVLLHHKDIGFTSEFDADIFGSMFTAVKTFIDDSFHSDGELKIIEHGSYKILAEEGNGFFLVVVGKGDLVEVARNEMKKTIANISQRKAAIVIGIGMIISVILAFIVDDFIDFVTYSCMFDI